MSSSYSASIDSYAKTAAAKAAALRRSPAGFFAGAMLAGTYIGIAMILALSTASGLEPGVRPLVMGATFGIGLILTAFAGAELFTGYVMTLGFGLARRTVSLREVVMLLATVWLGNLVGGVVLSAVFVAGGGGALFANADTMFNAWAHHKVEASAIALLARAILCNWLVCLAVWTASRMSGDAAKCIGMAWILLAFVAAGFEHSVANMTGLTLGLMAPHSLIDVAGVGRNLAIVTVGNIIGALVFVVFGYLAASKTEPVQAVN